ncbi:hypothetical protein CMK11_09520 [Candidatus Poribacteria bacterium]|jgi:hypothetical protein|nr:hypothetical protein [Candidatus Poribacteria bacterium]
MAADPGKVEVPWYVRNPSHRREYKRVAIFTMLRDLATMLDSMHDGLVAMDRRGPALDRQLLCTIRCGCTVLHRMAATSPFGVADLVEGRPCSRDEGEDYYEPLLALMDPAGPCRRRLGSQPPYEWPACPGKFGGPAQCVMPVRERLMQELADKAYDYLTLAHTFVHLLDGVSDHPLPFDVGEDDDPELIDGDTL